MAEDNEINALLTHALLIKLGHHPTVAANGAAAIECWLAARAGDAPYDRILMDLHMPGMDGLEAARRIRANEAEIGAPRTPILALTANASAEDRESLALPRAWTASSSSRSTANDLPLRWRTWATRRSRPRA